jgi:hypothetical protein
MRRWRQNMVAIVKLNLNQQDGGIQLQKKKK